MPLSLKGYVKTISELKVSCWSKQCRLSSVLITKRFNTPTPEKIRLRQYQEESIQAILSHLEKGHKRLGISLATGSGKTIIFTQLIDRVPNHSQATQTLILAHRQELVEQAALHCLNAYPSKRIEIEMGASHSSGHADITIASIQSLVSGNRISKFNPSHFKLVLVDEAHHIVAPGYLKVLKHFGLADGCSGIQTPTLVGVSATMSRFDGLRLGAVIDHIVYHKDYIDMIGESWLSDQVFSTVRSKADISAVKKGVNGDFQPGELSRAVNTPETNQLTFRSWMLKAMGRKSTLIFCVDLTHVTDLTNTFKEHGIDARFVTGNTSKAERVSCLDSFRKGEFPVLVNCGVFTEGTDIPNIDCVLLARPTKSRNLLVQMIGRGMRLYPGKENCHVIDMVANLEAGIITTPTLFGLDPSELVENMSIKEIKSLANQKEAERNLNQIDQPPVGNRNSLSNLTQQDVVFTDYDSVFDLIEDTSEEEKIWPASPHAWVSVAPEKYILPNFNGSYLRLEKLSGNFIITETVAMNRATASSKAPFMKPRQIATAKNFTDAVHAADTYAQKKYPYFFIMRNQSWRKKPASESQLVFLNKLRSKDEKIMANTLTKGKAGDMITKIKHGARGRFAALDADRRRESMAHARRVQEEAHRKREHVVVGPLSY